MKKLLVIIAMCALAACASLSTPQGQQQLQFAVQASQVAQAVLTSKAQVATAEQIILSNKTKFSADEWAQLTFTDEQVNSAVGLINNLSSGSSTSKLVNLAQLTQIYSTTKAAYISAKSIVKAHESEFTPFQRTQLEQLDASMVAVDTAVQGLKIAPNGTDVTPLLISALQVAALTAKVAVMSGAL